MKSATTRFDQHRAAFSLIELLISMAIIAILGAVLFPVFAQARDQRRANCLGNHHQLVEALALYSQDYGPCALQSPGQLAAYMVKPLAACPNGITAGIPKDTRAKDAGGGHRTGANMLYHNGIVMPTTATAAIFWGPSWNNTSFVGDKISGLDAWYMGFGGSHYAATSDEYTGTNGQVTTGISYYGHYIDLSASPTGQPSTTTIQNEVCKMIPPGDLVANGYYAVYIDHTRGNAGFCAWHSYGSCSGVPIQFSFFFDLDGDPGCDPGDTSGLHSQGLAALANVSGHELSEARTDPRNGGWYDSAGAENGDKCAWTFGAPLVTFSNGVQWKVQGEWSNAAYTAGTGYSNSSGQKGCLSGL